MKEKQLSADHGRERLRARTVKTGTAAPLLPPRSSSVPLTGEKPTCTLPGTIKRRINQRYLTPLAQNVIEHNPTLSGGLDTTDVESIDQRLPFATDQLRQQHRLNNLDTTSMENSTPTPHYVSPQNKGEHKTFQGNKHPHQKVII